MTTSTNHEPRTANCEPARPLFLAVFTSEYLVLILSLLYFLALLPFTPGFGSAGNLANLLSTLLPLFVVAMGQTIVLITGGIDLSVTSIIALTSITGAAVMNGDTGWLAGHALSVPVGLAAMLGVGAVVGVLNGLAVTRLRLPPFIVTLTTMMLFSGLAVWLTQSRNIGNLPAAFNALGGQVAIALPLCAALATGAHLMLSRSLWGRWLHAAGHNPRAALISGVPVGGVQVSAYVVSGLLAAVGSVLYTGQAESGSPVLSQRLLLDIVGATVIGGTSLFGGKGKILWTLFGVLFLKLIDNSLNLLDLSYFSIMMVKGGVILLAALLDTVRNRALADVGRQSRPEEQPTSAAETVLAGPSRIEPAEGQHSEVPAIQFHEITKRFGSVPVLRRVSFAVPAGHTVGLVGENGAGKSTLMNILGGNLRPDGGGMTLLGQPYAPRHPTDAARAGIAFVHQELNLFPNLSIAENLFLTAFPRRTGLPLVHRSVLRRQASALLAQVGLPHPPDTLVGRLSAGERQLVEIAKALSLQARLIILDEPTSSLSAREAEALFALLGQLRARGISMIYISHALGEVLRLCDEVVVLRDGEVVGLGARAGFTAERMVALMVGRNLNQIFPPRPEPTTARAAPLDAGAEPPAERVAPGSVLFEARHLSQPGVVCDISFTLQRGEVLGLAGLMGAGRSELARILFGLDPCRRGELFLEGRSVGRTPMRRRIRRGLAFLTEDRRQEGLCLEASIADNMALVSLREHARGPLRLLDRTGLRQRVRWMREAVRLTAAARDEAPVKTLSGGNQQKVVLAKWLLAKPLVLILDEPTRGIDVGAKFEIYLLIQELASQGTGVLLISSELEELIGLCDRILVMSQGEVRQVLDRPQFDRERILRAALERGPAARPGCAQPPQGIGAT